MPQVRAVTAPSAAPPETPSKYGSASGLRNTAWKVTPDKLRAAPTNPASNARGKRICQMITCSTSDPGPWRRIANSLFQGRSRLPAEREINVASRGDSRRSNCHSRRLFSFLGLFIKFNIWMESFSQGFNAKNHPWSRAVNPVSVYMNNALIPYCL